MIRQQIVCSRCRRLFVIEILNKFPAVKEYLTILCNQCIKSSTAQTESNGWRRGYSTETEESNGDTGK